MTVPQEYKGGSYLVAGGFELRANDNEVFPAITVMPTRPNITYYDPEQVLMPDPISDACGRLAAYCIEGYLVWGYARPQSVRVADMGTGSGIFVVSLLDGLKLDTNARISIHALDNDAVALDHAKANIDRSAGLSPRLVAVQYDCQDYATGLSGLYNYIYFNPPYLEAGHAIEHADAALAPAHALYADHSVDEYERVLPQLHRHLADAGLAFVRLPKEDAAVDAFISDYMVEHENCRLLLVTAGKEQRKGRFLTLIQDKFPAALSEYDYFENYLGGKERRLLAQESLIPFYHDSDSAFSLVRRP